MTPADCPTLEAFANHFLDEHDALALRAIRCETMTNEEHARLADLNAALMRFLPSAEPLPEDVRAAMAEALLLGA